ncbi:MAG: hypothetical protein HN601_05025 [Candidatus Marinimicrobia bacterium]|jgi:hypothetical protein|nr:hypothetical protein [Candidatus Neomarinimicrobiota bacterium]
MLVDDFVKWAKAIQDEENTIMLQKGKEYTISHEDKFQNFKSIGKRLKLKPEMIAIVYLLKHIDSICNYVITGAESSNEPIRGRIQDARNYLLLLGGLITERMDKNNDNK